VSDREIDTMNTSSIDLICCGLGATLLLMLFISTLVRSNIERAQRAPDSSTDANPGDDRADQGFYKAPPEPLVVTVKWENKAKYRLRLIAYPPQLQGGSAKRQKELELAEETGTVRVRAIDTAESDTHFGFFDRRPDKDGKFQLKLVIPGGCRSAAADALARRALNDPKLSEEEKEKHRTALEESHAQYWQFEVKYPDRELTSPRAKAVEEALQRAYDDAAAFNLVLRSPEGPNQSKGVPLKSFAPDIDLENRITIEQFQNALQKLIGGKEGVPVSLAGFEPTGDRDARKISEVWREAVFPELVRAAAHPRDKANSLPASDRISRALETAQLEWEDLAEASEHFVPGSREWLGSVRKYASFYMGTDPVNGDKITVTLEVLAYKGGTLGEPWIEETTKKWEVPLSSPGSATFVYPNP
jgi:hypothetical protein